MSPKDWSSFLHYWLRSKSLVWNKCTLQSRSTFAMTIHNFNSITVFSPSLVFFTPASWKRFRFFLEIYKLHSFRNSSWLIKKCMYNIVETKQSFLSFYNQLCNIWHILNNLFLYVYVFTKTNKCKFSENIKWVFVRALQKWHAWSRYFPIVRSQNILCYIFQTMYIYLLSFK